jgi:polyhydroxybutyrate depolymerase
VILLHDYASSGAAAEAYFQLAAQADSLGFLYAHPDGVKDSAGNEFWNATNACCDDGGVATDDSSYLDNLIIQIRSQYNVDRKRVYVLGYGNGGFMAYRLACDHSIDVTAIADLGGATWADASKCVLKAPMSALEIHGTADETFAYDGGTSLGNPYPSAPATIAEWVALDRCTGTAGDAGASLDLDSTLAGTETTVTNWNPCPGETSMALWTIAGGSHTPTFSATFAPSVLGFLLAKAKP